MSAPTAQPPLDPATRDVLHENFLFHALERAELDGLLHHVWHEDYASDQRIVTEGEVADALYLVVKGGVNVTKASGQFLAYLGRAGFFGEMALFADGAKRTAHCTAAMPTRCAVVRKDHLEAFCNEQPEAGLKIYRTIIRTLSERLQATSADLAMLMATQVKPQADINSLVEKAKSKREP